MNSLRTLRKQAGMRVSDLAKAVGKADVTITSWESGTRALKPDMARKVLDALAAKGVHATFNTLYSAPTDKAA